MINLKSGSLPYKVANQFTYFYNSETIVLYELRDPYKISLV